MDHEGDPVSGVLDENKEIYVYFREAEEYTITINYYRYGTTQKIAKSVEIGPEEADSEYSISRSLTSGKRIAGYRYHSMSGDATSGILDEDKEINVYFRRVSGGSSEEPDDPPTPPTPPYVPEVIIPDENVPQAPLPMDDTSDNEITIIHEEVPLGNLPNTGDESMVALLLMVMIAALAGIVILVRNKKSA